MATATQRLAELGIAIPEVVPPVAAYVPAVVTGRYVYTSGQLPMRDGAMIAEGLVGSDVDADVAKDCARQSAINALAAAQSVIGSLDRVTRVVKVVGFVASAPGFTGQPGVINGASELLLEVFGDLGRHARSAVGVAGLPLNAPVEVEMVLEVAD
ncbi:MAG: LysR family transcriptional regulator [Actinomycetales bacterium mxb001]|nr:MAG: LysR family transcriptional regulator [Actinomycetales bacterium mxb001]